MPDYRKFKISVNGRPEFATFFTNLRDQELKRRIDQTLDKLKERPDAGDLVQHSLWPQEYRKLELDNLFRIEVGRRQRMTYSIRIEGFVAATGKHVETCMIAYGQCCVGA